MQVEKPRRKRQRRLDEGGGSTKKPTVATLAGVAQDMIGQWPGPTLPLAAAPRPLQQPMLPHVAAPLPQQQPPVLPAQLQPPPVPQGMGSGSFSSPGGMPLLPPRAFPPRLPVGAYLPGKQLSQPQQQQQQQQQQPKQQQPSVFPPRLPVGAFLPGGQVSQLRPVWHPPRPQQQQQQQQQPSVFSQVANKLQAIVAGGAPVAQPAASSAASQPAGLPRAAPAAAPAASASQAAQQAAQRAASAVASRVQPAAAAAAAAAAVQQQEAAAAAAAALPPLPPLVRRVGAKEELRILGLDDKQRRKFLKVRIAPRFTRFMFHPPRSHRPPQLARGFPCLCGDVSCMHSCSRAAGQSMVYAQRCLAIATLASRIETPLIRRTSLGCGASQHGPGPNIAMCTQRPCKQHRKFDLS